jgi:hypothetical protein
MNTSQVPVWPASFYNNDTTESFSKISCLAWMYPIHIALAYVLVASGFLALVSRIVPSIKWLHVHFGRTFMMTMYFTEG